VNGAFKPRSPSLDRPGSRFVRDRANSTAMVMDLHLSDEQTAALERELRNIVDGDRFPFSARCGRHASRRASSSSRRIDYTLSI